MVFSVPNMKCGGCARSVTAALHTADPAAEIEVDLERREVIVRSLANETRLIAALRAAGFDGERLST